MPNSATPWSETDLIDLKNALYFEQKRGASQDEAIVKAAEFLCRGVEEVRAKAAEMKGCDG